ncbi:MAG TPA: hypothetical protein ENK31_01015 [Nannocystis exedens]|nr:hypothetical protein [Nannocystis exedens]
MSLDPGSAHGTRGTSAVKTLRVCIVSSCRHERVRVSYLPHRILRFAVKLLRLDLCQDPALCKRFAHEFSILFEHHHSNLVAAHDYDRTKDGQLFIVLERLHGQSLDQLRGPLPPARVVRIAKQLGSVLQHLHQASVLHRDLKPSNVILLDEPPPKKGRQRYDRIKLVDLGIASGNHALLTLPTHDLEPRSSHVEGRPWPSPRPLPVVCRASVHGWLPAYRRRRTGRANPADQRTCARA